jgi:hypothetical protein
MPHIGACSEDARHLVYGNADDFEGEDCMAVGCDGQYAARLEANGTPHDFKGLEFVVYTQAGREKVRARPYSGRRMRDRSRSPVRRLKRSASDASQSSSSSENYDDSDVSEWLGEPTPFKGIYSRLTVGGGVYTPRPDLATIVANMSNHKVKQKHVRVAPGIPNGGQAAAMGGKSAEKTSGRNLPVTTVSDNNGGGKPAAHSEEWCHLQAACLGGPTILGNLVAASHACNTYMMAIETSLQNQSDYVISVTAYCTGVGTNVAEAIRYRVFRRQKGGNLVRLLDILIDATAQHFAESDLDALKTTLKQKGITV